MQMAVKSVREIVAARGGLHVIDEWALEKFLASCGAALRFVRQNHVAVIAPCKPSGKRLLYRLAELKLERIEFLVVGIKIIRAAAVSRIGKVAHVRT